MKTVIEKTYGVSGMLEWHTVIRCGRACLRVRFEGGALSGYGVTPAEFTTSNRVAQHIIENSAEFRSGRIKLLRQRSLGDAHPDETAPANNKAGTPEKRTVHLSCREDAREWLIANCGVPAASLRSHDSIRSHAALHGITFIFDGDTAKNENIPK